MLFNCIPPLFPYTSILIKRNVTNNYFFDSGRSALLTIINYLKSKHQNLIFLIPAYTCHSVLDILIQSKVNYDFIDLSNDLNFDLDDLNTVVKIYKEKKIVLIATSLFGAELKDYKSIYKDFIIIEDLAQSTISNNTMNSDFQFTSYGRGKLVSSWNGGMVKTRHEGFKIIYEKLDIQYDFCKSFILSNIQKFISRYMWLLVEKSPLNPQKEKRIIECFVEPKRISNTKINWILTSMSCINTNDRIMRSNQYLKKINKEYLFDLKENIPYLRFPIKKKIKYNGISYMDDYSLVYESARKKRKKDFNIPQILAYSCCFLPTHNLVNENYINDILGTINE
jgi:hypothetical protein